MTEVSVVMPAYNAAKYIEAAITSILNQTHRDYELIVINDGSTDNTLAIAQQIAARDSRIKIFNQENLGIVKSLNKGLALSTGKYIARMDADDISAPNRLERQLAAFKANPHLLVCGTWFQKIDSKNKKLATIFDPPTTNKQCKEYLLLKSCFAHPSVMINRSFSSIISLQYLEDYLYAEDYKLWSTLAHVGEFYNIPEKLLLYRVHNSQVSSRKLEAQRRIHSLIASENLNSSGIAIDADELHHLLWGSITSLKLTTVKKVLQGSIKVGSWSRYSPAAQVCWLVLKKLFRSTNLSRKP